MTTAEQLARAAERVRRAERDVAERDRLIRLMHAEGASLRQIAAVAGMSHGAIAKIVKREGS